MEDLENIVTLIRKKKPPNNMASFNMEPMFPDDTLKDIEI